MINSIPYMVLVKIGYQGILFIIVKLLIPPTERVVNKSHHLEDESVLSCLNGTR